MSMCSSPCLTHRQLSIFTCVEVPPRAHAGRDGRVLLAAHPGAAHRPRGGADRSPAQGAGGPRQAAAVVPHRLARRRRGVPVRPQRRLRALPAHHQPPPQGAARDRAARAHQARRVGLLPGPARGTRRPGRADRRRRRVSLGRRVTAEAVGTAFLVMAVVGSGIAAQRLSPGDRGLQLLENSLVTGAALTALVLALQPVSASFNPVVTAVERALGLVTTREAALSVVAQVLGGLVGVLVANLMFELDAVSVSSHHRASAGTLPAEVVATAGLVVVVFGSLRAGRLETVAYAVGGYITAAYWFTSSTSFASRAVTLARTLSDPFAGIAPASAPAFVAMQLVGGAVGLGLVMLLHPTRGTAT